MTNKQKGILFLVGPFAGLVGSLALYGLFASMLGGGNFRISQILKIVFGFIGMVSVVGIPFGLIFGIKSLKKEQTQSIPATVQGEKYKSLNTEQTKFINSLSWGAFFGAFIWALGNGLYLWALGFLVPFWNIYVWIKLLISGRKLAWENKEWKSFEQFKKRQMIIMWIIIALYVLKLLSMLNN